MIRNRERNFGRYLEKHFGIILPDNIEMFYAKGVRVGNKEIRKSPIRGELGYAACDFGFNPTNSFIQNFGHLAKKNIVRLNDEEAKRFAAGENITMDLGRKAKHLVVMYKKFCIGLAHYDGKKLVNKIPKKRARRIVNSI